MLVSPRTPPRVATETVITSPKKKIVPLTPQSVMSPPRSADRGRTIVRGDSLDSLFDAVSSTVSIDPSAGLSSVSALVTEAEDIDLRGLRTYLELGRRSDETAGRRAALSTTVGCCPITEHGPMRFGCSFAGDVMCSNCGVVMQVNATAIGREVVLLDERSSSNLHGTVTGFMDGGVSTPLQHQYSRLTDRNNYPPSNQIKLKSIPSQKDTPGVCTVRLLNGTDEVVSAAKLRLRLLECSAGPTHCCDFHLCSSCYLGQETDILKSDAVPFNMSLDLSELLWGVELVDSVTGIPLSFSKIFSRQTRSRLLSPGGSWVGPSERGINFLVLPLFAVLHLAPSVLVTRVVARKILKNLTRRFNCPAAALFQDVSIKLSDGSVVPATAPPEYFMSQAPEAKFIESVGTALAYFNAANVSPSEVFVFEPSFCVNQWTEEVSESSHRFSSLSPVAKQAVVSCRRTLFIESPSRQEKHQLARLYQLLDVYNFELMGQDAPFEALPQHQQQAVVEGLFSDSRRQAHLAVLSAEAFHRDLVRGEELVEVHKESKDEQAAHKLDALIERDVAKLEELHAEMQKRHSVLENKKLTGEINRVENELQQTREVLVETEARIVRDLEKALDDERAKLHEHHGRESAERDASWGLKHQELEDRLRREHEKLTEETRKCHAAEVEHHINANTETVSKMRAACARKSWIFAVAAVVLVVFSFIAGGYHQSRTSFYTTRIEPPIVYARDLVFQGPTEKDPTQPARKHRRFGFRRGLGLGLGKRISVHSFELGKVSESIGASVGKRFRLRHRKKTGEQAEKTET